MRPRFLVLPLAATALFFGVLALAATPPRLARLNIAETELSAEQARNMTELARLLSVLVRLRRDPPPALLVPPQQAKDAVTAAILIKAMTPELQRRAEAYGRIAADMGRERRLAAVENEALFTRESEAAEAQAPPQAAAPRLRGPIAPASARAVPPGRLLAPLAGRLIRRFGESLPSGGRANGLSLAAPRAAAVAAPGAGLVQYVGPVRGWGVILILRLAGGYHLVLAGLDRSSVSVGQSVAAGQTVGWMPDARQSSPELYLEVRDQGAPVDPARWLKINAG